MICAGLDNKRGLQFKQDLLLIPNITHHRILAVDAHPSSRLPYVSVNVPLVILEGFGARWLIKLIEIINPNNTVSFFARGAGRNAP